MRTGRAPQQLLKPRHSECLIIVFIVADDVENICVYIHRKSCTTAPVERTDADPVARVRFPPLAGFPGVTSMVSKGFKGP